MSIWSAARADARPLPSPVVRTESSPLRGSSRATPLQVSPGRTLTHQYLAAFAALLADSDGYHANRGRIPPGNGWEVVADALQAAPVYE
jgi:hypothetical protein